MLPTYYQNPGKIVATMVGVILLVFLPLLGRFLWIFDLLTLSKPNLMNLGFCPPRDSAVDQESHQRLWTSHILVPWAAWESPSLRVFCWGSLMVRGFLCIAYSGWGRDYEVHFVCESRSLRINLDVFGALRGKVFVCDSKVALGGQKMNWF